MVPLLAFITMWSPSFSSLVAPLTFTFGTNNVDSHFGRLEYALEAIEACGLQPSDLWFPSMSIRSSRPVVIYNHFEE
jgi:hypothetical protein